MQPIEPRYGHPMFHTLIEEIRELHEKKNKQYATPEDPLGNFRRTGKIIAKMLKPGLDPTLASCLAFMSKQVDGVYEIFGEAKTDTIDSLEDKLLDIAVYSIIAMIMVREARGLKLTNEYHATWGEPPLSTSGPDRRKATVDRRQVADVKEADRRGFRRNDLTPRRSTDTYSWFDVPKQ
jgi:hypothetical protein